MNVEQIFHSLGTTPVERLLTMIAQLRDPETGCPWDVEQTFETIAPYTIEEAYEVSDAIDRQDNLAIKEELGDLLLQVIFQSKIAEENNLFDFYEVCDALMMKMIIRHPHVFGSEKQENAETQTRAWENLKAAERKSKLGSNSVLAGVTLALPALMRAEKLQKRAARAGFDWPDRAEVVEKIVEKVQEIADTKTAGDSASRIHDEVGDLLFAVTNLARKLDVDPEHALRDTNNKFESRFRYIEENANGNLSAMTLEDMDALWDQAKKSGL